FHAPRAVLSDNRGQQQVHPAQACAWWGLEFVGNLWGTSPPDPLGSWRHGSGVRGVGKTMASDGLAHQRPDAPSAHPRPGYPLPGCFPAEPDSVSPGAWQLTVPTPWRPDTFGHPSHASENPAAKPRFSVGRRSEYAHA